MCYPFGLYRGHVHEAGQKESFFWSSSDSRWMSLRSAVFLLALLNSMQSSQGIVSMIVLGLLANVVSLCGAGGPYSKCVCLTMR